jgi:hypothetical protein
MISDDNDCAMLRAKLAASEARVAELEATVRELGLHLDKCCEAFAKHGFVAGGASLPYSIEISCMGLRKASAECSRLRDALDTIDSLATVETVEIQRIARAALGRGADEPKEPDHG